MARYFFSILLLSCFGILAWAAELTPENLIGRYRAEARVGFQNIVINFRVLDTKNIELQRMYMDGNPDELCNGTYALVLAASGKKFKGTFTCPSNRSKIMTFDIDFANKNTDDLIRGTYVPIVSSMAPGVTVRAYVIRL